MAQALPTIANIATIAGGTAQTYSALKGQGSQFAPPSNQSYQSDQKISLSNPYMTQLDLSGLLTPQRTPMSSLLANPYQQYQTSTGQTRGK